MYGDHDPDLTDLDLDLSHSYRYGFRTLCVHFTVSIMRYPKILTLSPNEDSLGAPKYLYSVCKQDPVFQ